jgi:hypothetical protein
MKRLMQEQLGRVLLVLSLVWAAAAWVVFPSQSASFPEEADLADYREKVRVDYKRGELAPAEAFFPAEAASEYLRPQLSKWVRRKAKVVQFEGVDLPDVTRARIMPAPQLLPDPGPSLKGSDKLPRWGKELPALTVPESSSGGSSKGKTGRL